MIEALIVVIGGPLLVTAVFTYILWRAFYGDEDV